MRYLKLSGLIIGALVMWLTVKQFHVPFLIELWIVDRNQVACRHNISIRTINGDVFAICKVVDGNMQNFLYYVVDDSRQLSFPSHMRNAGWKKAIRKAAADQKIDRHLLFEAFSKSGFEAKEIYTNLYAVQFNQLSPPSL
jgi:hypothetical protein